MVNVAAAGIGAVARAGIVVTARLRAIERFKALSGAIAGSNNALLRFGRRALITSGQISIVSTALGLLTHPVTGLLALLQTGLSTRSWLLWERAARRARVQLVLTGMATGVAADRINELRQQLGTSAARELFSHAEATRKVAKLHGEWAKIVGGIGRIMDQQDFPDKTRILGLLAGAVLGNLTDLGELRELLGLERTTGDQKEDLADVVARLKEALEEETDFTNIEQTQQNLQEIRDKVDPAIGSINDALAIIPRLGTAALKEVVLGIDTAVKSVDAALGGIETSGDIAAEATGASFNAVLEGEWEKIPGIWKDAWTKMEPELLKSVTPILTVLGIAIGFVIAGPIGGVVGAAVAIALGPALEEALEEEKVKLALIAVGALIGTLIAPGVGTAIGAALGLVIGEILDDDLTKATEKADFIVLMGIVGAGIGTLLAPAIGTAMGAAIGLGVAAMAIAIYENRGKLLKLGEGMAGWILSGLGSMGRFVQGVPGMLKRYNPFNVENLEDWLNIMSQPPEGWSPIRGNDLGSSRGSSSGPVQLSIYIGDKKVDTVVLDSMTRIARFNSGLSPTGMIAS